jgi:hypothetical protein
MKRSEESKILQKMLLQIVSPSIEERENAIKTLKEYCYKGQMSFKDVYEYYKETSSIVLSQIKKEDIEYSTEQHNLYYYKQIDSNNNIDIEPTIKIHTKNNDILKSVGGEEGLKSEENALENRESCSKVNTVNKDMPYMCRANMNTKEGIKIVNGDLLFILGYNNKTKELKVRISSNNLEVTIPYKKRSSEWIKNVGYQGFPIIQSYAMTIHKAQGATIENGIIFESRTIINDELKPLSLYTALSRVKHINKIRLTHFIVDDELSHPNIQKKLEYIWKLPFMKDYLKASDI